MHISMGNFTFNIYEFHHFLGGTGFQTNHLMKMHFIPKAGPLVPSLGPVPCQREGSKCTGQRPKSDDLCPARTWTALGGAQPGRAHELCK